MVKFQKPSNETWPYRGPIYGSVTQKGSNGLGHKAEGRGMAGRAGWGQLTSLSLGPPTECKTHQLETHAFITLNQQ